MDELGRSVVASYLASQRPGAELTSYFVARDEYSGGRYVTVFYRWRGKSTLLTAPVQAVQVRRQSVGRVA